MQNDDKRRGNMENERLAEYIIKLADILYALREEPGKIALIWDAIRKAAETQNPESLPL